jgi:uncharacterized protein (TIGR02246 family)
MRWQLHGFLLWTLLLAWGALPLAAAEPPGTAGPAYPQDAPAVRDRLFNQHDAAALAAQYAESATSMPFDTPSIQGRAALQADFAKFFAANAGARHETRVVEVLRGDGWAIERAEYTLTFTPEGSGKPVVETGRHVVCRRSEGGRWLIVWELWNRDKPAG